MKYSLHIKSNIQPYLAGLLIAVVLFCFYYLLDFFLLNNLTYCRVTEVFNQQNASSKTNNTPMHSDDDSISSLTGDKSMYKYRLQLFNKLKNSKNADQQFILAQCYDQISLEAANPGNEEIFAEIRNEASDSYADCQDHWEKEALSHFYRAVILNPLSSKYHILFAEYLDFVAKKRLYGENLNPAIKKIIVQHFESAIILDNKWDHPFRAYGNWLFSYAKSEEVCNNGDLLKQTLDRAVYLYKEAIRRNKALFSEGLDKYSSFTHSYDELKKLISDPEETALYYALAKYLQGKGLWEANENNFYNDIKLHDERFLLYRAIVEYLSQKKRFSECVYLLKEFLEYAPDDVQAHLWLGNFLFWNIHNKEDGLKEIEIALNLKPEDLNIQFYYGKMLFSYEDYKKSIEVLKKVLLKDEKRHEAHFIVAQSYEKLLNVKEAEKYYENAISLSPNSDEYKKRLARLRIELKAHEAALLSE